jgi:biopolymer transport protein ExbD
MNTYPLVPERTPAAIENWFTARMDALTRCAIEHAASQAPPGLKERLQEEWAADALERRGGLARLRFACGCYWAVMHIDGETPVSAPTVNCSGAVSIAMSPRRSGTARRLRATAADNGTVLCEMNTTPLIDVMLVLLVTLILSLPIMTHAVKLDLPPPSPPQDTQRPEVIDLDIYYDGTVAWNGVTVSTLSQLESYFLAESGKSPQPEIHLRPDAHVRYDAVAQVLAAAQRNGMSRLGFVNTADFQD